MLAYQTLDLFEEKQKIRGAGGKSGGGQDPTYMGLVMETFLEYFQLDIFAFISNTNYKYIIIKNENKTSAMGQKPSDSPIKNVRLHDCVINVLDF